jgi:hypothetical protein
LEQETELSVTNCPLELEARSFTEHEIFAKLNLAKATLDSFLRLDSHRGSPQSGFLVEMLFLYGLHGLLEEEY